MIFDFEWAIIPPQVLPEPVSITPAGPLSKPTFSLLLSYDEAIALVNKGILSF